MLLSPNRTIALTCVVFVFVLLTGYQPLMRNYVPNPLQHVLKNGTIEVPSFLTELNPFWTTEQLEPRFAYAQYATDMDYLCNAVINFNRLDRFGSKHDQVLIFPDKWAEGDSKEAKAIKAIQTTLPKVVLRPFDLLTTHKGDSTWANSLTKFHAFDLTDYTRVLAFDSDSQVLNNMDHYFLAPMAALAVPRAYWLNEKDAAIVDQVLGSHVMLLEPNEARYKKIIDEAQKSGDFDMEVINHLFKDSVMILPHRRLALLTGEFRGKDHRNYLAPDEDDEWNAMGEVSRAYLVHFSDWPLPKPWKQHSSAVWEATRPECPADEEEKPDRPRCADRVMWEGFYEEYNADKERYCAPVL
ncbi:glucose N-acetyltransferase [Diaporthe amygdali]|uniref:glucose N-acetyltransferase n=1 Tax=Phomopsis amygdali TaxID=1214568 RepID=UPI0022FDB691|nr:glucose N-acetyltransferase [Diaporthe amygdali]KAJ0113835.1 glucose N-acetyltransferase [Diaporthe amygdali]